MAFWLKRLLRGSVVGLMLLLAASANLVSFSYDADDDDETPPVTVELSIGAPVKKAAHLVRQQSSAEAAPPKDHLPAAEQMASAAVLPSLRLHPNSPQLVIPLRT
ncbi:MAG TPA: hypothetical protein VFR84_10630 [Candidatus Angelobacter sp.]|nr:hypothetical protein [Candidatus Angelobacter sp.]